MPNESSAIRPINTILSWPLPKRSASTPNPPSTPLSRSSRKWRPPNFGTRRAITIDFTSGIIILDVQFSIPGRPMGGSSSYFLAPLLPNGGRCMSKKQSLLTLLALITLIVNFEVRANSLIVAQPGSRLPLKPCKLPITRGVFAGAIRQLLLDSNSQRFIPVIVRGAAKRDYAPLKTLVGQALRTIGGINFGMNTSVICSEEIPRIRPADIKRESAGAFLTGSVVQTRIDLCREWPRGRAPANYFEPVKSNIPVLLISGELDPATPFEWGDEAARHLPNSLHIIQPGVAHGPFTSCAQSVMNRFVEAGTTTGLDATCVKELKRPAFLTPPQSHSIGTLAQPKTETAFTPAQLEDLLDRLSEHTESYKETFKD